MFDPCDQQSLIVAATGKRNALLGVDEPLQGIASFERFEVDQLSRHEMRQRRACIEHAASFGADGQHQPAAHLEPIFQRTDLGTVIPQSAERFGLTGREDEHVDPVVAVPAGWQLAGVGENDLLV